MLQVKYETVINRKIIIMLKFSGFICSGISGCYTAASVYEMSYHRMNGVEC